MVKGINELSQEIHKNAKDKGFYDNVEKNTGELLMLAVSELSEAFEADRKGLHCENHLNIKWTL